MESKNELMDIINEIIALLKSAEEQFWCSYFEHIKSELLNDGNQEIICIAILRNFQGGMGSLNDLVLHKENKMLIKENDQLDVLKDRLYECCKKERK